MNAAAPVLCANPRPARIIMSAPSMTSNVTAIKVCVCVFFMRAALHMASMFLISQIFHFVIKIEFDHIYKYL